MTIQEYIDNIARKYASGMATEHTFRSDLETLLQSLVPSVRATNEPKRIACGAPDYVLTHKDIPVGYIEAKDVGKDLDAKELKEQFDRYRNALNNLVFTDYLDFRFYFNGQPTASIKIAEIQNGKIVPVTANFEQFTSLIKQFCERKSITIKSAKTLAEMMADKAKILAFIIKAALEKDIADGIESDLTSQMKAFKDILIHDIDAKAFADIYAQTIAYGMFAARLHDPSLETFSRKEAAELIPKTNPFLRKLFQFIAAFDLDTRIDWIVDALADLFRATDIAAILKNFGTSTQTHDPIMHFYETFLAEYDPKLRKSRGVFYTPEPVVDFIVRAVDDILKTEFNLPQGLADTSKTKIKVKTTVRDERTSSGFKEEEKEVHKVQILDPATGTGTFLAAVIKQIYKGFENQQGIWNQYVDEHLVPRLNGFELLMASYAMAHLKLDLLLSETGYGSTKSSPPYEGGVAAASADGAVLSSSGNQAKNHPPATAVPLLRKEGSVDERTQRFQIYLTNALEEYHPDTGTLFATWLSTEANEANHIKRDTPVMVVIGNPPYSVSSSNKSEWIENLVADYKANLNEKNISPLSDDYIKFIRFGQHFVDKNGEGILAYISNNSFVDGLIHRQMRKSLLDSFDRIYILDLHGSSNKEERTPDGGADENVFDIMQGVSINIFVKSSKHSENRRKDNLAEFFHADVWGKREEKYEFLEKNTVDTVVWNSLEPRDDDYFFTNKDFSQIESYSKFVRLTDLFVEHGSGIMFRKDNLLVKNHFTRQNVVEMLRDVIELPTASTKVKYDVSDTDDWKLDDKKSLFENPNSSDIVPVSYRPFDLRYTYYPTDRISQIIVRGDSRVKLMKNFVNRENLALLLPRQAITEKFGFFISNLACERNYTGTAGQYGAGQVFPLYLYPQDNAQQTLDDRTERVPNLNSEIVEKIAAAIGLRFVAEKAEGNKVNLTQDSQEGGFTPALQSSTDSGGKPAFQTASSKLENVTLGAGFAPIDILDYIYAVLHSPTYREKYKEFLKIDFPRVPYPKDAATFWQLAALGGELRQIHLLESPVVNKPITGFKVAGNNVVEKPEYKNGSVFINATQHFSGVPETAWNFYIGGYQPAQKWLKDRKGRNLSFEDIQHYQKIIVALTETDRLMKEIDKIGFMNQK